MSNDQHEQDTVAYQAKRTAARLVDAIHRQDGPGFYEALRFALSGELPFLASSVVQTLAAEVAAHQVTLLGRQDARESTTVAMHDLDWTGDSDDYGPNAVDTSLPDRLQDGEEEGRP
ncbi:hypothetical protein [uncultured Kocuria sp.]|uniref:hypothetical protein n=1 Tax=uncultured Kocuria sp. TaxID=259305 RepID=UPI00260620A0|nr:hypothetical protein [uncultured Kocuria sp.]